MSLKLIELQVALPRTQDVGKIQEQLQQRGQHMQDQITAGIKQQDERKRKQVGKNDKKDKSSLHLDQSTTPNSHPKSQKQAKTSHDEKEQHPYIGKIIDISG
ncbi:hypothetical protein [Bacillus sp. AK128]